jgi:hypothetical protein
MGSAEKAIFIGRIRQRPSILKRQCDEEIKKIEISSVA